MKDVWLLGVGITLIMFGIAVTTFGAQPPKAASEVKWGGKLVSAKWQAGIDYSPDQYVVDSSGIRQLKSRDSWNIVLDEDIEIGLRSDGVLVWRKASK